MELNSSNNLNGPERRVIPRNSRKEHLDFALMEPGTRNQIKQMFPGILVNRN
jgi:hypothetical protein